MRAVCEDPLTSTVEGKVEGGIFGREKTYGPRPGRDLPTIVMMIINNDIVTGY